MDIRIGPGVNRSINKLLINEKFVRNSKCVGKFILKWFGCKNVYISVTNLYRQLGPLLGLGGIK